MEAKELRIGNLLINGIGEVFEVNGYAIFQIGLGISAIGGFKPIPLTPEWLERAGFVDDILDKHESICIEISLSDKSAFIGSSYAVNHGYGAISECQYVHQLQNLYWCLCGKELEFKEI